MTDQTAGSIPPSLVELQRENRALMTENQQLRARIANLESHLKIDSEASQMMTDALSSMVKVLVNVKERSERGFT